ncbi:MAG: hypothetical protein K0R25_896 [Rickettsiaceae bacterium]|jgi:hypothetical protein|nr:hypothetical protein [Rickettsiaceae bacterium]
MILLSDINAIDIAIKIDDIDTVKEMLMPENYEDGLRNYKAKKSCTFLSQASKFGAIKVMEYLVDICGADIYVNDNEAFRRSALYKKIEPMDFLLNRADPSMHQHMLHANNNEVFHIAGSYGHIEKIEYLLNRVGNERREEIVGSYKKWNFANTLEEGQHLPLLLYICALLPENEREGKLIDFKAKLLISRRGSVVNMEEDEEENKDLSPEPATRNFPVKPFLRNQYALEAIQLAANLISWSELRGVEFSAAQLISIACKEESMGNISRNEMVAEYLPNQLASIVSEYLSADVGLINDAMKSKEKPWMEDFKRLLEIMDSLKDEKEQASQPASAVRVRSGSIARLIGATGINIESFN